MRSASGRVPWRIVAILCLGVTAAAVAGSTATAGSQHHARATAPPVIGYSLGFLNNPALAVQVSIIKSLAKNQHVRLLSPTNANGDPGKQITDVRSLIGAGAKGLILTVGDSNAIIPALNDAAAKKIPVVAIDIGPAGGKWYMVVKADNILMGTAACHAMARAVKGSGRVLDVQGDNSSINGRDRSNGFDSCIKKNYPNIKLVSKTAGTWNPEDHAKIVQTALAAYPDLKGVYLQSDAVALQGVLAVMKTAGRLKKVGQPGHISVITIDGTPLSLASIRARDIDAVISQPISDYAKLGLRYILAALAGKTYKVGRTDHGSKIIRGKGGLIDQLPSPVVTLANVKNPSLWGNATK